MEFAHSVILLMYKQISSSLIVDDPLNVANELNMLYGRFDINDFSDVTEAQTDELLRSQDVNIEERCMPSIQQN